MPAGVYLPRAELQSLVDETNEICGGPCGEGLAPITIIQKPRVLPALSALILEGFEALAHGRRHGNSTTLAGKRAARLSDAEQDRHDVQSIAKRIWANGRMSIEAMLRGKDLAPYVKVCHLNKLRGWLSEVDQRPAASKPGRRHKTTKS